jgi:hypothetical protein
MRLQGVVWLPTAAAGLLLIGVVMQTLLTFGIPQAPTAIRVQLH